MERIETAEALAGLMNAARPRRSNCYRLPEDLHKAVEAGRLYAHRQPGALMLLEEWPDVFQVCALVYDVAAPCEAPCVAKPLLAECITRGGPVGACGQPARVACWKTLIPQGLRGRRASRCRQRTRRALRRPKCFLPIAWSGLPCVCPGVWRRATCYAPWMIRGTLRVRCIFRTNGACARWNIWRCAPI